MIINYIDSSAWIKRYCLETGSAWVAGFFAQGPAVGCSALGLIEVMATLARKHRARQMDIAAFLEKSGEARRDFKKFHQVYLTRDLLKVAETLPQRYALRGADTTHLASCLYLRSCRVARHDEVRMIACDADLIQAARKCGFAVINPEDEAEIPGRPSTL